VSQAQADAAGNDIILSVTLSRAASKLWHGWTVCLTCSHSRAWLFRWLNNRMLRVDDLTERGVQIVRNLMREFIPRAGSAVALRSLVKLQ